MYLKYWKQFIRDPEYKNVLKEISDSGNLSTLVLFTAPTFPYWKFSCSGGNIKCVLRLMWASQISSAYLFLIFLPSSVSSVSPHPTTVSASIKLSSNFAPKLTRHCTVRLQRGKLYLLFGSNILLGWVKSVWKDKLLYL